MIGPTEDSGRDLGFVPKSAMVAEFAEAAFAMRPSGVSNKPVQTTFGWYVIMVEDRRISTVPSYKDSVTSLREQETRTVVADILGQLEKRAKIQRFNIDGTYFVIPAEESNDN